MKTLVCLSGFAPCLLLATFASAPASAHNVLSFHSQYARLSPGLASQLRERDTKRTATQVRGFEAASSAADDKRQRILDQFSLAGGGAASFEQIYIKNTLWPAGHTFRACFFDGPVAAREKVLDLFEAILKETNLKIDRTDRKCPDNKSDIQIRFNERDCFSYYGKDALDVIKEDVNLATIGLCHLTGPTWTASDEGTIRHEMMHALGAAHEHQHPNSKCKDEFDLNAFWNPPLFDPDPTKNEQAITANIRELTKSYSSDELKIIKYDPESTMHYKLNARFFKPSPPPTCMLLSENTSLSEGDWAFLRTMYPKQ